MLHYGETEEGMIAGRYEVSERLGGGGLFEVYKAYDKVESRTVALKVVVPHLQEYPALVEQLLKEAKAAAKVQHAHIVKVYGVEHTADGVPFIVMEFIEGISLDKVIKEKLDYNVSELIEYMIQAADGLRAAFTQKIIHCDVKPRNMLRTEEGEIKLVDFGLAKAVWTPEEPQLRDQLMGTPLYMSPEQIKQGEMDHRSDIYSLGASFYHVLSGRPPFEHTTLGEIMTAHLKEQVMPLSQWRPDLCIEISDTIQIMLQKEPERRYQDYDELISDLSNAKLAQTNKEQHQGISGEPLVIKLDTVRATDAMDEGRAQARTQDRSTRLPPSPIGIKKKSSWWSYFFLLLCVIGIAGFLYSVGGKHLAESQSSEKGMLKQLIAGLPPGVEVSKEMAEDVEFMRGYVTYIRMRRLYIQIGQYEGEVRQLMATLSDLKEAQKPAKSQLRDGWEQEFKYVRATRLLVSAGADGKFLSGDDFVLDLEGANFTQMPSEWTASAFEYGLEISQDLGEE